MRYADTSFLVSLVTVDANHAAAQAALVALGVAPCFLLAPFGELEARNTIRALVARRHLTIAEHRIALNAFSMLERHSVTMAAPLPLGDWLGECERLSAALTTCTGTRTLDVMHVALAHLLGARDFFSFDANQRRFAAAVGLTVLP